LNWIYVIEIHVRNFKYMYNTKCIFIFSVNKSKEKNKKLRYYLRYLKKKKKNKLNTSEPTL